MSEPVVFISYSHDSETHKEWVLQLASDLRGRGIDTILDQWDLSPGEDITAFMEASITRADRVILVCSESYVEKAENGLGGVAFERLIVTAELVEQIDTKKFVPVVRRQDGETRTPRFLGARFYIDLSSDSDYDARLEELAREIHGMPSRVKPPLGPNPYSGTIAPISASSRVAGPTGLTRLGESVLDEAWFEKHAENSAEGLRRIDRSGAMSIRSALHDPVRKSQLELLNAVRGAEIRTFGWPIGILLENKPEWRPKPMADGIVAEVAVTEKSLSGKPSYDYWALRGNGDFFLEQSLFEDERRNRSLFFDTRIVRVSEAFLFLHGLYQRLGAAPQSRISIGITHRGLAGRTITSASSGRHLLPAKASEERSEAQVSDTLEGLRSNLVEHVMQVTAPLFMLFDFQQFERSIYADIVTNFANGKIS